MYQEYATAKAYDEARGKFNEECSDIASIKDLWQCFERIIETAREPQRSEEDLRAQKEMAQWSYWMVIISAFVGVPSIGIAWAALYWIVQTWALQRRATEAAIKAVKITEETAKRQLRAYVGTSRVYIRDFRPDRPISVVVEIQNFGQTPAHNYEPHLWLEVRPHPAAGAFST